MISSVYGGKTAINSEDETFLVFVVVSQTAIDFVAEQFLCIILNVCGGLTLQLRMVHFSYMMSSVYGGRTAIDSEDETFLVYDSQCLWW